MACFYAYMHEKSRFCASKAPYDTYGHISKHRSIPPHPPRSIPTMAAMEKSVTNHGVSGGMADLYVVKCN